MRDKTNNAVKIIGLFLLVFGLVVAAQSLAITGPSAGAGVGSGLINVEPTGTGNLSVGATAADTSTKFQITGTTANSSAFGLKVWPSSGSVNFQVRNDGVVSIASTTYVNGGICFGAIGATDCVSSWSGVGGGVTSTPAGYITPGYFNSIAGTGGNYSFPASLSVGTSTAPSGGSLFVNGNVGIGTANISARLNISGDSMSILMTPSSGDGGYLGNGGIIANNEFGLYDGGGDGIIAVINNNAGTYHYGGGVIVSNGTNIGIGTSTPGSTLTAVGTIYSTTGGFKFPDGTTQTTAAGSGTNYWTLSGTGLYPTSTAYQVGVGTTEPHYPLEVYGASNKLGIIYSYSALAGDSTGGELYAGSNGDLHINAKRTTTLVENRNILLSEAGGNVGIGTSTPGSPLSVVGVIYSSTGGFKFPDGTTQTTAATGGSGTNYFTLSGTSLYPTSTAYELAVGTASVDTNYAITTAAGGIKAESTSQPAGYFNSSSGYGLLVNAGNVGIGTTTPSAKLEVVDDISIKGSSPTIVFDDTDSAGSVTIRDGATGYLDILPGSTAYGFLVHRGTNWGGFNVDNSTGDTKLSTDSTSHDLYLMTNNFSSANLVVDGGTGYVGISTTTPSYPLTVAGTIHSSTGGYRFPDGTTQTTAATAGGGGYGWTTSGTSVILATSTNNVGIGQTPTYKLDVNGVIRGQGTAFSGDVLLVGNDAKMVDIDVLNTLGIYSQSTPTEGGILLGSSGPTIYGKSGNVGIATTTPGYPLTVNGTSLFTGTMTIGSAGDGKLNVGTVDPPYTINGTQYATYMPGMTGQKEETTGEINIQCPIPNSRCKYVIDFTRLEKGSDLWLFAKTTNLKEQMDKMTVLLTPGFDGKVWYEKDVTNLKLTIFVSPSTTYNPQPTTYSASYRFTAARFDSAKWSNTRNEPGISGFVIND